MRTVHVTSEYKKTGRNLGIPFGNVNVSDRDVVNLIPDRQSAENKMVLYSGLFLNYTVIV